MLSIEEKEENTSNDEIAIQAINKSEVFDEAGWWVEQGETGTHCLSLRSNPPFYKQYQNRSFSSNIFRFVPFLTAEIINYLAFYQVCFVFLKRLLYLFYTDFIPINSFRVNIEKID